MVKRLRIPAQFFTRKEEAFLLKSLLYYYPKKKTKITKRKYKKIQDKLTKVSCKSILNLVRTINLSKKQKKNKKKMYVSLDRIRLLS